MIFNNQVRSRGDGRPRRSHKPEIAGSNPASATIVMHEYNGGSGSSANEMLVSITGSNPVCITMVVA